MTAEELVAGAGAEKAGCVKKSKSAITLLLCEQTLSLTSNLSTAGT
jgi:hypothetical protein